MRMTPSSYPHKSSTPGAALCAALVAMLVLVGCASAPATTAAPEAPAWTESELIPLGDSPRQGDPQAPVVIVEFSSLQCPFSARARQTVVELLEAYPGQVQLVYKHMPLSFQPESQPAARAAEAAGQQGAFWPMVESLYASQQTMGDIGADAAGRELASIMGLDEELYASALAKEAALNARIERDTELAAGLGVQGTPNFFINGEPVRGAQPRPVFEAAIERALARHAQLEAQGVAPVDRYARSVEIAQALALEEAEREAARQREQAAKEGPKVLYIPVRGDELIHQPGDDFLVTMIEYSSLTCPFCARAMPTVQRLKERYGEQLRVVYKHFPLGFQEHSEISARAVVAAQEQDRGWEMRDAIYGRLREVNPDVLRELASGLELDMEAFEDALQSDRVIAQVQREMASGQEAGVRGTPSFFINGVFLAGAQPVENFERIIDEQIDLARELQHEAPELRGEALYERVVKELQQAYGQ